ncbi:MAG: response regulator transcription factor [Chloroflexi bacterium]|nr:response regulator transcription factor [Chloroflexota bacterium]
MSVTRLLVVEDEPRLGSSLEQGLAEAHYTVDLATDGEEALSFADTSEYDAVVLDLLLPRVDGLEVCRRLRARGFASPILLLTARDAVEDRVQGLDSGADDYLTKPFAFAELLARLRALLRRDSANKEPVLRVSRLTLDPASHIVRWGSADIDLTAREYRVLETLLRHPGWIVSRDAIIESVWGFDYPDSSNLVEVYVGRLRRKLAEQGAPPLIQTVRGAGYRVQEVES